MPRKTENTLLRCAHPRGSHCPHRVDFIPLEDSNLRSPCGLSGFSQDPVTRRRVDDSNLRCRFRHSGFQDQCIRPLCQPSALIRGKPVPSPRAIFIYYNYIRNCSLNARQLAFNPLSHSSMAGVLGFGPRYLVLETRVLPLDDTPNSYFSILIYQIFDVLGTVW